MSKQNHLLLHVMYYFSFLRLMKTIPTSHFLIIVLLAVCSCDKSHDALTEKMNIVKELGNSFPDSALTMLDSLQDEVDASNEYIRHKNALLSIRLRDKAYMTATNDNEIKRQVRYFEKNGSNEDRQESYYYAGSVYRDLQDTPSALEYFLKSADCKDDGRIDSVMLRNTYSQLNSLYYDVQDYTHALEMARKEIAVADSLGLLDARTLLHEGAALMHLDSVHQAHENFCQVMDLINKEETKGRYGTEVVALLHYFSTLKDKENAETCSRIIREERISIQKDLFCNLGTFFLMENKMDSALYYYQKALDEGPNMFDKYNAARMLVLVHHQLGNKEKTDQFAGLFVQINDSLNLGENQKLAATANNKYRYFKDKEAELTLKADRERYKLFSFVISSLLIILLLVGLTVFNMVNNRKLKKLMAIDSELKNMHEINKRLQEEQQQEEQVLDRTRQLLENKKQELQALKADLDNASKELQETKQQLQEKIGLSKQLLKMVNKSTLKANAESITTIVYEAAKGTYIMQDKDWRDLCCEIDKLFPSFREEIIQHLGKKTTEQQVHFCYLLKAGLTQPQIRNVLDMPKSTAWTWAETYKWVLE